MNKILLLNGPNLNLLGQREPAVYGSTTLSQIEDQLKEQAHAVGFQIEFQQSNAEADLISWIQQAPPAGFSCILLNAGGLTHTSVSLRDAVSAISIPTIEIHMSNIYSRESFRHKSLLSGVSMGTICGFGAYSYRLVLDAACYYLKSGGK
jgi:3-dehydroquinate dehydratase-2